MVAISVLYVAVVFTGYWWPRANAVFVLASIVTALIIFGYWLAIADSAPVWEAWTNRALAISAVWITALFVWHIRGLEEQLRTQIGIANALSRELSHRVGNGLQMVAAFLQLHAAKSTTEASRQVLEAAISRVMIIGRIQRALSHLTCSESIDSDAFLKALTDDVRSTLPNPDRINITVEAETAQLSSTTAVALGAIIVELATNALKHAFRESMQGTIAIKFKAGGDLGQYVVEVEDDGIGIDPTSTAAGSRPHIGRGFPCTRAPERFSAVGRSPWQ
jgi:two-component sensor histidine kinase